MRIEEDARTKDKGSEKSVHWTRLAAEIDHLLRQPSSNYRRRSMPQMQKATTVWIEPTRNDDPSRRWGWMEPKTEFERTYFFHDRSTPRNAKSQRDPFANNDEPYSGTRERLREIFERNRYLRRKFFDAAGCFEGEGRSSSGRRWTTIEEGGDRFSHGSTDGGTEGRRRDEATSESGKLVVKLGRNGSRKCWGRIKDGKGAATSFRGESVVVPSNLCKSLPNLSIGRGRANQNSCETKSHDKRFFPSHTDPPDSTPDPNSFALRRSRLPPPLDLSTVNERYEELERSSLVHVALIRNYNCPLEGRPTVVRDECCSSDENREEEEEEWSQDGCSKERRVEKIGRSNDDDSSLANPLRNGGGNGSFDGDSAVGESVREDEEEERRIASRCLDGRKKCGRNVVTEEEEESWKKFLTAMDELQSPQLVNDCKNSMMMDSRRVGEGETFHERRPPPPLSKSVNSTNGGQAGNGSTLPSVYGPIPYSQ